MRPTLALFLLLLTPQVQAQEDTPAAEGRKTNLEWAAGPGEGFRQLHDPVVAAYAISQLGALVCAQDRDA